MKSFKKIHVLDPQETAEFGDAAAGMLHYARLYRRHVTHCTVCQTAEEHPRRSAHPRCPEGTQLWWQVFNARHEIVSATKSDLRETNQLMGHTAWWDDVE